MASTSFQEQLLASLTGVNTRFEKASADLHEEVTMASNGVQELSDGEAALSLSIAEETENGTIYSLQLQGVPNPDLSVAFYLDTSGYPIRTAPPHTLHNDSLRPHTKALNTRDEVHAFLMELASNPDSPLVVKLAFFLRRKSTGREVKG